MNVSLPDALIRHDLACGQLRTLLVDGLDSGEGSTADEPYLQRLRVRARGA